MKAIFHLSDGIDVPAIAFGTWRLPDTEECVQAVKTAVSVGYRHIDTAAKYGNEVSVGKAVQDCGVPREQLFVTTKLRNTKRGYDTTRADFDRALRVMGLDYVDAYLMHWPAPAQFYENWAQINADTWRAMEELKAEGRVRSIGVSNFCPRHVEALKHTCHELPAMNQIKFHPGLLAEQKETLDYCKREGIQCAGYSPLGAGAVLRSEQLAVLSGKYGKSPAQLCVRWCLQHGVLPLPKSSAAERMQQNLEVFDFELTPADMEALDTMPNLVGAVRNPDAVNLD